ncbi:MAG: heme o synthase [Bacteroidia bacterium]|nr:heme o synthase [Bacteroidia bacterium]
MNSEVLKEEDVHVRISIRDIAAFGKLRLATLVVMSAAFCYILASGKLDYGKLMILVIGGFLVTAASNGFNQIIERHRDKLMNRTKDRPLPAGRMTVNQAIFIAVTMATVGILMLWLGLNPLSGILSTLALILYSFVYTPLKKVTTLAVHVGAIPGAIPPMLGYASVTGELSTVAIILFLVQFVWQFPHFWAIAWVLNDDYLRAGYYLLPSRGGRNKNSALQILFITVCLIPVSLLPMYYGVAGNMALIITTISSILFALQAVNLYIKRDIKSAKQLMFGSFLYLPVIQIALIIDKL